MGIKGLSKFLAKRCPEAIRKIASLDEYTGKRFAVDVSVVMYRFAYWKEPHDDVKFLENFYTQYTRFKSHNISATYVFDGSTPVAKAAEICKRQKLRHDAQERIFHDVLELQEEAELVASGIGPFGATPVVAAPNVEFRFAEFARIQDDIEKRKRSLVIVKPVHYTNLRRLFDERSVPYVIAPGEAEKECARMCARGEADVAVTEDFDALPYGAPVMLRGGSSPSKPLEQVCLQHVLDGLNLTHPQFVDFCILCGSDFSGTIPGIGPVNAYKLIRSGSSMEKIVESYKKEDRDEIVRKFTYEQARNEFTQ